VREISPGEALTARGKYSINKLAWRLKYAAADICGTLDLPPVPEVSGSKSSVRYS
jgi:hypothetical protein